MKKSNLQIILKEKYPDGFLYELNIDYGEEIEEDIKERLWLGYFFVTNNKIYRISNFSQKEVLTPDDFYQKGIVVCQEEAIENHLRSDGISEYIKADGDIRQYGQYNTLTETGFYERFVWKKRKGFIQYVSGFGAERDVIEIIVK